MKYRLYKNGFFNHYRDENFNNGRDGDTISLCSRGVFQVFGVNDLVVQLDIRLKNPKKKGFKKIQIDFNSEVIINGQHLSLNWFSSMFANKHNLKGQTIWVKIAPI